MSKKSSGTTRYQLNQVLSYVALFLAAVLWLLDSLHVLDKMGQFGSIARFIRDIALLGAIALGAYGFAKKAGKAWYIIYWIIIVVAIVGIIFGSFNIIK